MPSFSKTERFGTQFLLAILGMSLLSNPVRADALGETFTCHFGRYGTVIIDTREPGATITINGQRHAAHSGSYFYQSHDGKVAVFFGPSMKWWEYNDVSDHHCVHRSNKKLRHGN